MKKYYTPEIEEFHVGFEYEARIPNMKSFSKEVFYLNEAHQELVNRVKLHEKDVRVKYLDKEDIESLGWVYHKPWIRESEGLIFISNMYGLTWFKKTNTFSIWERMQSDCEGETYFQGIIKNKSELVKLLKQLGY